MFKSSSLNTAHAFISHLIQCTWSIYESLNHTAVTQCTYKKKKRKVILIILVNDSKLHQNLFVPITGTQLSVEFADDCPFLDDGNFLHDQICQRSEENGRTGSG